MALFVDTNLKSSSDTKFILQSQSEILSLSSIVKKNYDISETHFLYYRLRLSMLTFKLLSLRAD